MFTKDLERLIRSLVRQKTDPEYIRHYLTETYQLAPKTIDELFEELGVGKKREKFSAKQGPMGGGESKIQRRPFS